MSSIAQDELGHAKALYELLAGLLDDGHDADAIAYDRPIEAYRHARLLDHGRGDWATTIARRFLYDTADGARLASIGEGWPPLAELVAKIRREERYHVMHAAVWVDRLARAGGEARERFVDALTAMAPDAPAVLTTPDGEAELLAAGILSRPFAEAAATWRAEVLEHLEPLHVRIELPEPPTADAGRTRHGEAFTWLHREFNLVRASEPGATW
jgi:ring-1,2-phenylacetyl-CoA epoxidase subunit PaaC